MADVVATDFLNLEQIEELLASHFASSLRQRELTVDCTRVKWISPLSLSTLFLWAMQVHERNGHARVLIPLPETYAGSYFAQVNAAALFRTAGISVQGDHSLPTRPASPLAAFETFESVEAFDRYRAHLDDPAQQTILLHSETIPEVISSGHVHAVLLKELVENTFFHGQGRHSHYSLLQSNASSHGRKEHPLLASFQGAAYLDICVGDSSPKNIVDSLRSHVPSGYQPDAILEPASKTLDPTERAILYAFEYASTSNPGRRQESIRRWLNDPELDYRAIATGLHDVASLVKAYRGQLLIRVDGRLGTLDFSQGRAVPRVRFWRRARNRGLAKLQGSIVNVRLPLGSYSQTYSRPSTSAPQAVSVRRTTFPELRTVAEDIDASAASDTDRLIALERALVEHLRVQATSPRLVALVLDNLRVDAKLLSAFFEILTRIPRRGNGLVLIDSDPRHLGIADAAWSRFRGEVGKVALRERPAFAVVRSAEEYVNYGYDTDPAATLAGSGLIQFPLGQPIPLEDVIHRARTGCLVQILGGPAVVRQSEDVLFLLEKSFYTDVFFETAELAGSPVTRGTVQNWFQEVLRENTVAAIVSLGTPFDDLLRTLKDRDNSQKPLPFFLLGDDNLLATAMRSGEAAQRAGEGARIALVADVVCTAERAIRFLRALAHPEKAALVALVDARPPEEEGKYVTIRGLEASKDVPLIAALRHPVVPLHKKPSNISARNIFVIDRTTFRPVRYPLPAESSLDTSHVLGRAASAGALAAGHFELADKHYVFFLALRPLFQELAEDISAWLSAELAELQVFPSAPVEAWAVLCVDEGTGLFALVERLLRDSPIHGPVPITTEMLSSPPLTPAVDRTALWFIVPAMGSGQTIRQCLEYARQNQVSHVQISVVVSRSPQDLLLFFQEIAKYRDTDVRVRNMIAVPLEAYNLGSCPVCALSQELDGAKRQLGDARPRLAAALDEASDDFSLLPVESAAVLGVARPRLTEESLGEEAWLVSLFTRGARDIEARRILEEALRDEGSARRFAVGLGRVAHKSGSTLAQRVKIVYDSSPVGRACKAWAVAPERDPASFAYALRGFAALVPNALRSVLPTILENVQSDPELFKRLAAHAATEADLYWELIESAQITGGVAQANLLDELRDFNRRGGARALSHGVLAIQELRRHFLRSLGWGMPLEILRISCRLADLLWGDFRIQAARFIRDGYLEAERRVAIAKRAGLLWTHLNKGRIALDESWRALKDSVEGLQSLLNTEDPDTAIVGPRDAIVSALDSVEGLSREFASRLGYLATRPWDAMQNVRAYSGSSQRTRVSFDCRVAPDCPALSIHESDLQEIVLLLLENAVRAPHADFEFAADEESSQVVMTVRTSAPWRPPGELEGGLVRIRELAAPYGGLLELPLGSELSGVRERPDQCVQRLFFPRWEE